MTDLDFQYFSEVARILNFSKAAENLFITQSALSRCIQKMEKELGARLLERDRHEVRLTAAGDVLLKNYNNVQKANELLRQAVRSADKMDTKEILRVGIQYGHLVSEDLRKKIESFMISDTPASVEVASLPYNELFRHLDEGMLDIVLAYEFPFSRLSSYEKKIVKEDSVCILVSEGHPLSRCATEDERMKMLSSMNLLCTGKEHQSHLFPFILELCRREGFQPKGVQYFPTYIDMANALILGKGFLVVNRTERMTIGNFIELSHAEPMRFSAFRLSEESNPLARRFMDSL